MIPGFDCFKSSTTCLIKCSSEFGIHIFASTQGIYTFTLLILLDHILYHILKVFSRVFFPSLKCILKFSILYTRHFIIKWPLNNSTTNLRFSKGSNGLTIVDYPIYDPNYDNRKHSMA